MKSQKNLVCWINESTVFIKISGIFILLCVICNSCNNKHEKYPELPLLFQSGFEPSSTIIPYRGVHTFKGKDETLKEKNDWDLDMDQIADKHLFNYTGGDDAQRFAQVVPDPVNPKNHVLLFQINEPWEADGGQYKARVQYELYDIKTGLTTFYQTVKIFLPESFKVVRKYPQRIGWLTIMEIWNDITWSQSVPYPFRITLGMGKSTSEESDLSFILGAEDYVTMDNGRQRYIRIWSEKNEDIKVPIGEWFTMHYYFKEGNAENGRFIVSIETSKHGEQTVFDITNFTHNTKDPNPKGVTDFNPLKLYTSEDLTNFVKAQGESLQIYWDDFKLYGK